MSEWVETSNKHSEGSGEADLNTVITHCTQLLHQCRRTTEQTSSRERKTSPLHSSALNKAYALILSLSHQLSIHLVFNVPPSFPFISLHLPYSFSVSVHLSVFVLTLHSFSLSYSICFFSIHLFSLFHIFSPSHFPKFFYSFTFFPLNLSIPQLCLLLCLYPSFFLPLFEDLYLFFLTSFFFLSLLLSTHHYFQFSPHLYPALCHFHQFSKYFIVFTLSFFPFNRFIFLSVCLSVHPYLVLMLVMSVSCPSSIHPVSFFHAFFLSSFSLTLLNLHLVMALAALTF